MNKLTILSYSVIFSVLLSNLSALNINDTVPNFEAIDSKGKKWSLENFRNKKHVLLFFTPQQ